MKILSVLGIMSIDHPMDVVCPSEGHNPRHSFIPWGRESFMNVENLMDDDSFRLWIITTLGMVTILAIVAVLGMVPVSGFVTGLEW